ncbi:hypothetical protein F3Y22_tig00111022pilonHSYRG00630 [Hibiscus syriacus]|uniref:Uncharacterized protein n=1 Tax=Hibiscus syriacus TaxID=106335 RepID=A0A6A2Z7H8_HIBSY|nr:hypothetical protein F3Y22_tig00111022pilonHSYRG00630 [Hibiscus syriacus]
MPEGSWKCEKCSNINYPFRTKSTDKIVAQKNQLSQISPHQQQMKMFRTHYTNA